MLFQEIGHDPTHKQVVRCLFKEKVAELEVRPTRAEARDLYRLLARQVEEKYRNDKLQPLSLDQPINDDGVTLIEILENSGDISDHYNPVALANQSFLSDAVRELFDKILTKRESQVLCARFGLNERSTSNTLAIVGEEFGVTRERIRQIQGKAILKLRNSEEAQVLLKSFLDDKRKKPKEVFDYAKIQNEQKDKQEEQNAGRCNRVRKNKAGTKAQPRPTKPKIKQEAKCECAPVPGSKNK